MWNNFYFRKFDYNMLAWFELIGPAMPIDSVDLNKSI